MVGRKDVGQAAVSSASGFQADILTGLLCFPLIHFDRFIIFLFRRMYFK